MTGPMQVWAVDSRVAPFGFSGPLFSTAARFLAECKDVQQPLAGHGAFLQLAQERGLSEGEALAQSAMAALWSGMACCS